MSQRTMKILSLAKTRQGTTPKTKDTSGEVCEQGTSVEFNKSLEEFDSTSNWVIEVEPQILKEQFYNAQDLKNNTEVKKKNSSDYLKSDDEPYSINENKYYEKSLKSLKSQREFKFKSENIFGEEIDGRICFFKSSTPPEKDNKSEGKLSQSYENVHKIVSTKKKTILPISTSETNKNKSLYPTAETKIKKIKFNEPNNNGINNMSKTESNFQVIVVPPKEDVAHLPIGSDFDLPIIFEKSFSIPKNDENQNATENYLNYSDESENSNFDSCLNKFSENGDTRTAILAHNKTKNYDIVPMHSSQISSELLKLPQSYTPITRKINVLSQYILKPNETEPMTFITETNPRKQNANELNSNGINDVIKIENYCQVPLVVFPSKAADTHFQIRSDFDFSSIREEDPYLFESDENQNAKKYSNDSEEKKNDKFESFFNDYKTSGGTMSENNIKEFNATTDSLKTKVSTELQESAENDIDNYEEEVEKTNKKHYKDKNTFCFYCDKDVTHFARHLSTWHQNEIEVQRLHSYQSKSKERRRALRILGKRGNYVKNRSTVQLRPVRRVQPGIPSSSSEFLPCSHCLGFYKKKTLYRHTKTCDSKPLSSQGKRQSSQSEGQTALLLGKFKHDELLEKELFPRMRADDVSLMAKKDPLICNYAYSYMKGRKSKGNLDFVRTSVRNLTKLLQLSKEWDNNIRGLIDLLRPTLFKTIIRGVNVIGGYNEKNDVYESPTVALNFGTLLKKCCDLAILQLLQEPDTETRRKEIKILKTLIESQWANEVSAQASLNLNTKKWNKEELLPLTSDLKKLKDYLERIAQDTFEELKKNKKNKLAYNSLKEVLYCQIILMNRRRPAEVAQIKVETYKSINLEVQATEFEGCLTETEKILLNSCSRMVIRGKRGRGVPVLLSPNMREQFDFLLNVRDNFIENNDYIFHTTGKNFLDGTKVLYKYAGKCDIQNPKSISATRLRKHLATVTQLLQFSEGDLEQLSRFMGHTLQTHCNFYRLSDSTYQTAKISKLLLLATEGGLEKYKGLDLNNINIDLNPISEDCDLEDIITEQIPDDSTNTLNDNLTQNLNAETDQKKTKCTSVKHTWSLEQKIIIEKYFAEHIKRKKAPKQTEVNTFLEEYPSLFKDRKWTSIKAVVYNFYTGKLIIPK